MTSSPDQRKHQRVEVILKVEYGRNTDFLADYAANASGGGVFIATARPFDPGEELTFSLSLPGMLSPILCHGKVCWRRSPEEATEEQPAGIGVSFLFRSEEEERQIRQLMERLTAIEEPAPEPVEEPGQLPPFRVLLAEDSKMVRAMFLNAMQRFHHAKLATQRELVVVEAENGKEAWEYLQEETFDLAVIDYYMPIMNGMDVIRKIRARESVRSLPIIVISAGGEEAQKAAYEAGADFFLGKPVMLAQLFQSFQRLIDLTPREL